jgi:hypothetical protein
MIGHCLRVAAAAAAAAVVTGGVVAFWRQRRYQSIDLESR